MQRVNANEGEQWNHRPGLTTLPKFFFFLCMYVVVTFVFFEFPLKRRDAPSNSVMVPQKSSKKKSSYRKVWRLNCLRKSPLLTACHNRNDFYYFALYSPCVLFSFRVPTTISCCNQGVALRPDVGDQRNLAEAKERGLPSSFFALKSLDRNSKESREYSSTTKRSA